MLTPYEQETVINFNREDTTATIFTYEKRWQRYIENSLHIPPKETNSFGGKTYIVLKKQISKPRKLTTTKRVLTPEQKEAARERFLKARLSKKRNEITL